MISKYLLGFFCWSFAVVWISTLYIQLNVALYEAIWSYPVCSLLTLGFWQKKLVSKQGLLQQLPCSVHLLFLDLYLRSIFVKKAYFYFLMKFTHIIKHFSVFSVTIPNHIYLLIGTLHISHRDNRLRWYPPLARGRYEKSNLKWSADLTNISFISCQNIPKSEKPWPQII